MSASLVGSEMCIRDRNTGGSLIGLPWIQGPRSSNFARLVRSARKLALAVCLLYTSDAADDM
eukprot:13338452-Alexandrium_andersonii.AAC.1